MLELTEVILPQGLLPDDTTLVYKNGIPICEADYNDPDYGGESESDRRDYDRYVLLALEYYNRVNHTHYQPLPVGRVILGGTLLERDHRIDSISIHCGFTAAPVECESADKYFCSKLLEKKPCGLEVTSCFIVDGIKPSGCKGCDREIRRRSRRSTCDDNEEDPETTQCASWTLIPHPSQYSRDLADGVILSDKAKYRLHFTLLALAYYNNKHHTDYKLVDVLPYCMKVFTSWVVHCNFIAKQNAGAGDASHKLFFAELEKRGDYPQDYWAVTACRVLRGKTRAGCHYCDPRGGKRVIHPTRGYRFGLYPLVPLNRPRLRDGS